MMFGTKADTLDRLSNQIKEAKILPLLTVEVSDWRMDKEAVLSRLREKGWACKAPLIVRSSALAEDTENMSQAGRYVSIPDLCDEGEISKAIDTVIRSYDDASNDNQVLIQPYLNNVYICGVAFSRDPESGAPYYKIEYSKGEQATNTVTSGTSNDLHSFLVSHYTHAQHENMYVQKVINLFRELESFFGDIGLDIEFAFDRDSTLHLFQVRPLCIRSFPTNNTVNFKAELSELSNEIELALVPNKELYGASTLFGVMPDWNPAEIIGIRPRPLALSLYRNLIMDDAWAQARYAYGYKDCRGKPLIVDFKGLPYIDLQLSFNSFLPKNTDKETGDILVNHYLQRLRGHPEFHDKVEFEILFSCYTPDLKKKLKARSGLALTEKQRSEFTQNLKQQTRTLFQGDTTWREDIRKISLLGNKVDEIKNSPLSPDDKIIRLLGVCQKYGTVPFSGLARAAFIATQWLNFLYDHSYICPKTREGFLSSIQTVGWKIHRDRVTMNRDGFIQKYGHLRPGTYDILSLRYDEAADLYFPRTSPHETQESDNGEFTLPSSRKQNIDRLLCYEELELDTPALLIFLRDVIFWREEAKFEFTKVLSDILVFLETFGAQENLSRDDLSYLDIADFIVAVRAGQNPTRTMKESIEKGRQFYALTQTMHLPPLITSPQDVWGFERPKAEPNFITAKTVTGEVRKAQPEQSLSGTIVMIPNADPGFDWIFARNIKGFITAYGGANSHMAIRAHEMQMPAAIGVGQALYDTLERSGIVYMDCNNRHLKNVA
ncbi:MAG: PEP-utilizing enzyme [Alphaproteobacteria bacterium]